VMQDVNKYKDIIKKCSHCGFCVENCPVYQEDLLQTHSARARLGLIRASLMDGSLTVTGRLREILSRCLLCTNCVQSCATEIPVDEIIIAARHEIFKGKRKNMAERYLMRRIMVDRGVRGMLRRGEVLARAMGFSPKDLPAAVSRPFQARYSGRFAPEGKIRARVAYYAGCATNTLYPETGADVVRVFTRNGIEVIVPEGLVCCGMPALAEGDLDTARELMEININILEVWEADAIITECTSCGMMLKTKAAKLFSEDDPLRSRTEAVAAKVWEATDCLNRLGLVAEPHPVDQEYTYHVPCHRGWSESINDAPRGLLARVPRARLIEMREPERCCGAGGAFFLEARDLSESIRCHKLEDIDQTGAKVILTQCPACRLYLAAPLEDHRVMHPISFLAKGYGPVE
jgi:glycolate oxidase iron-sulfur subunit